MPYNGAANAQNSSVVTTGGLASGVCDSESSFGTAGSTQRLAFPSRSTTGPGSADPNWAGRGPGRCSSVGAGGCAGGRGPDRCSSVEAGCCAAGGAERCEGFGSSPSQSSGGAYGAERSFCSRDEPSYSFEDSAGGSAQRPPAQQPPPATSPSNSVPSQEEPSEGFHRRRGAGRSSGGGPTQISLGGDDASIASGPAGSPASTAGRSPNRPQSLGARGETAAARQHSRPTDRSGRNLADHGDASMNYGSSTPREERPPHPSRLESSSRWPAESPGPTDSQHDMRDHRGGPALPSYQELMEQNRCLQMELAHTRAELAAYRRQYSSDRDGLPYQHYGGYC